ncbi:MAG: hypothetical protein K0S44_3382 [Bacteroidetes bacterium]|jgi:uncharacterized RDD family membrane protein YckC|nr:hypothetical protein [Bacteroidota bacterium]
MDNIQIQTTQNVDIEYEVASIGDRILATLLDYLFFLGYILLLFLIVKLAPSVNSINQIILLIGILPVIFYDLLCETFMEGRSFGKMIMKIKVVKVDGTQANFGAYLIRWLFRIIDTRLFMGGLALITIMLNGKGQRLGDMAAGTTVIKLKQKVKLSDTILSAVKPEYHIVFNEVQRLSDNDISIIKEVIEMSRRTNNSEAIKKLSAKTKEVMQVSSDLPDHKFLITVLEDYTHYNFDK